MSPSWKYVLSVPLLVAASALLHACGADSSGGAGSYEPEPPARDAAARTDAAIDSATVVPPPEVEERRTFQTPQAGGRWVYVANPTRDTVAVIDSRTLAIQTLEAGDGPTYLATVPGRDTALVVNVNSHTLTILRTTERGTARSNVPVVPGVNAIAIAPDGRHAVVYFDASVGGAGAGTGSFQDITLVTLDDAGDSAVQLSVGFRTLDVLFSADGASAFVVTEDGISILRFREITGPTLVPNISLEATAIVPVAMDGGADGSVDASADASADPPNLTAPARDVSITPDGRFAVARVEGTGTLRLVDLTTREITALDLGSAITDLDIAPSGAYALAVLRARSEVVRIPLPMGFRDPTALRRTAVTGEFVGSVTLSPEGSRALLYTTALPLERMTLMDLTSETAPLTIVRLRKPVRAMAFAPDGRTALVVHARTPGDPAQAGLDLEAQIDRSYGYSLFDVATRFAKLQLTPAEVGPFAIVPDGSASFVLLRDDARLVAQAQRVSMRNFVIDTIQLGSPPLSVGAVPGTARAFIGQDHPEGRITFVDWNTGALQSLTGFELNSRVVD